MHARGNAQIRQGRPANSAMAMQIRQDETARTFSVHHHPLRTCRCQRSKSDCAKRNAARVARRGDRPGDVGRVRMRQGKRASTCPLDARRMLAGNWPRNAIDPTSRNLSPPTLPRRGQHRWPKAGDWLHAAGAKRDSAWARPLAVRQRRSAVRVRSCRPRATARRDRCRDADLRA